MQPELLFAAASTINFSLYATPRKSVLRAVARARAGRHNIGVEVISEQGSNSDNELERDPEYTTWSGGVNHSSSDEDSNHSDCSDDDLLELDGDEVIEGLRLVFCSRLLLLAGGSSNLPNNNIPSTSWTNLC